MELKTSLEVILQNQNERKNAPFCKHGPGLLFQKADSKFFACSAIRQQATCPLHVIFDDWINKNKIKTINSRESFKKLDTLFDIDKV